MHDGFIGSRTLVVMLCGIILPAGFEYKNSMQLQGKSMKLDMYFPVGNKLFCLHKDI